MVPASKLSKGLVPGTSPLNVSFGAAELEADGHGARLLGPRGGRDCPGWGRWGRAGYRSCPGAVLRGEHTPVAGPARAQPGFLPMTEMQGTPGAAQPNLGWDRCCWDCLWLGLMK